MSELRSTSLRLPPAIQKGELQPEGLLQQQPSSDAACVGEAWHGFELRLLTAIEALLKQSLATQSRDLRDMMKDVGACPPAQDGTGQTSFADLYAESKAADLQEEPAGDIWRCSDDSHVEVRIVHLRQLLKKSNDENIELHGNITRLQHTISTMQSRIMELIQSTAEDHDVAEEEEAQREEVVTSSARSSVKKHLHLDQDLNEGFFQILEYISLERSFRDSSSASIEKVASWLQKLEHWWKQIKEPERTGLFYHVVKSRAFETTCQIAIILNAVLLAYAADWQVKHIGIETEPFIDRSEVSFLIFFLMELILRLVVHRLYFFVNQNMYWNIFDFFLVFISVVDLLINQIIDGSSSTNLAFMRVFRVCKVARVLRSLRLFRFISSLTTLMDAFLGSLNALFWGCIMFSFVMYVFSMIFMEGVKEYLQTDDEIDPIIEGAMEKRFGSLIKTFLSLYKSVAGGEDWNIDYELLLKIGPGHGCLFIFFMMISTLGIANLITASVVEKSMSAAEPSRIEQVLNQRRKFSQQKAAFLEICRRMDKEDTGKISWPAFKEWIHTPVMIAYMASIDLDIYDAKLFFASIASENMIKSGSKPGWNRVSDTVNEVEVPIERFVEGCMHMKGAATAIDMQRQLFEMQMLGQELKNVEKCFGDRMRTLEKLVSRGFNSLACRDTISLEKALIKL